MAISFFSRYVKLVKLIMLQSPLSVVEIVLDLFFKLE